MVNSIIQAYGKNNLTTLVKPKVDFNEQEISVNWEEGDSLVIENRKLRFQASPIRASLLTNALSRAPGAKKVLQMIPATSGSAIERDAKARLQTTKEPRRTP